jgi:transcriptional regulator with XRE-family HTH domain
VGVFFLRKGKLMKASLSQADLANLEELYQRLREIRAGIGSQQEVARLLSHDQSQISRYERGKRVPPLAYIRQLVRHAALPFIEEQYLLALAGACVPTRLPSIEQIKNGMEAYCLDIQHDWYPSIIVDHNFGIWVLNEAAYDVLGEIRTKELIGQYVTVLEMIFSSELEYNPEILVHEALTHEAYRTRIQQIALFKLFNIQRRHEAFYRNYPEHLGYIGKGNPRIRPNTFIPMWQQVDVVGARGELQFKQGSVEITGILPSHGAVDIKYRQRLEPIPHLPSFGIIRFEPFPQFESLFARYKWVSKKLLRLWEISDIGSIMRGIDKLNLIESY